MNGSVLDIRTEFLRRIAEVRNRKRLAELSRGAALTLLAAPGVALVLLLLEGQFRFGPGIRTGLVGTGALLVLVLLAVSFGVPLLKRMRLMAPENDEEIAGRIGGEFPDIRDRLLNALQLCSRRPDGENLYLEWAGWSMIALPEEFIIVDDEVLEVFVSSEEDMKNSFSVEWIE